MTDRAPWVSFYPDDWEAGTSWMPPLVEWVYFRLCRYIWDKSEAMPAALAPMMLGKNPDWQDAVELLTQTGHVRKKKNGDLLVERALQEAEKANRIRNRRRIAGETGGKARAKKAEKADTSQANAKQTPKQNDREPEPEPEPEPDSPVVIGGESRARKREKMPQVSPDIWQQFLDFRMLRGSPIIGNTAGMVMSDLAKIWHTHRQHPDDIIQQSLDRQWSSLRPLRPDEKKSGWRLDD